MIQGVACDLVKQRDALVTVGKPSNYIIDRKKTTEHSSEAQ